MTRTGLTKRMGDCIEFLRAYQLEHGTCPSFDEIAKGIGISAKSRIHRIISALEERGHIRRLPGKSRSIELIPAAPVLTVELPPHLYANVQDLARKAKVTPEAVLIEAVRDGFRHFRSESVPRETSGARA